MIEFTVSKVRELKGAPLACLVLLSLSSLPVSKEWLARTAGYTDKPISQALSYLQDQGYVGWSRSGWSLANGFQFPLSRNNSDSEALIIINSDSKELKELKINNNNNSGKYTDSLLTGRNNSDSILGLLRAAGVMKNRRVMDMIALDHVTEDYVRAKIEEYKERGTCGAAWAGLLIRAIESAEPAPALELNPYGHKVDCDCVRCKVGKVFGWKNETSAN